MKQKSVIIKSIIIIFSIVLLAQVYTHKKTNLTGEIYNREFNQNVVFYPQHQDDEVLWGGSAILRAIETCGKDNVYVVLVSDGLGVNVFKDDKHGISVRVESANNVVVVYSNLDEKTNVKKGQEVTEGQVLGTVGNTTSVESEDGTHVHVEAFKGEESIDPMTLLK